LGGKSYLEEDLNAVGGLEMFNLLLPYVERLCIAEVDSLIPGDNVFREWEKALITN